MSEQENIAVAQQGYNNFKTGNIAALVDQATDDIVWQLPEVEGVALSGKFAGFREYFDTAAAAAAYRKAMSA